LINNNNNNNNLTLYLTAITPTSRYCYKSWACDGDVIDDVIKATPTSQYQQQTHSPSVVGRERCFSELGGHSWGLYGENCEKRSDDEDQQPAHYVPDTLHGAYVSFCICALLVIYFVGATCILTYILSYILSQYDWRFD